LTISTKEEDGEVIGDDEAKLRASFLPLDPRRKELEEEQARVRQETAVSFPLYKSWFHLN
jgi:hypothetical protein